MDPSAPGQKPPTHPLKRSKTQARYRLAVVVISLVGVIALVGSIRKVIGASPHVEAIGYTDLLARGAAGDVTKAEIDGERVLVKLKNGGSATAVVSNAHSQP